MRLSSQRNYLKDWFFTELTIITRKTNIHETNFIILNIWNSNVKTQSGIGEIREAIDDFGKKQKSANTNKTMATDLNTCFFSTNGKVTVWQMKDF